jgi:hypothetical protein
VDFDAEYREMVSGRTQRNLLPLKPAFLRCEARLREKPKLFICRALKHDPEKLALGLDPWVDTGSRQKIMLKKADGIGRFSAPFV